MEYNILCIDESDLTGFELSCILRNTKFNVIQVRNEAEFHEYCSAFTGYVDMIVIANNKQEDETPGLIRRIKKKEKFRNTPIIVISVFTEQRNIINAIMAGAEEYIRRPFVKETIVQKFAKILKITDKSVFDQVVEDDIITFNFTEMFRKELKAAGRGGYPLSVMLATVLPAENGLAGLVKADDTVVVFSRILKKMLRETDVIFRYTRDTLILLLPFADKMGAETVADKIIQLFKEHFASTRENKESEIAVTSVTYPDDGRTKEKLFEKLKMLHYNKYSASSGS